ncbi:MAG: carbohydrate kinase family protein [Chloroflexota bacterium]
MEALSRPKVALIGPLNMDLFIRGSAPLEQDALNAWVGPSEVDLVVAGSIGYTAQAFARLGSRVELHSAVGDDAFGDHVRRAMEEAGLDVRYLVQSEGETAIAIYMMLFGGQKRPMTYRLPGFEPWADPPPVLRSADAAPDVVHCGGLLHFPGMWHRGLGPVFEAARAGGVLTSIDPQFPLTDTPAPWSLHLADVLPHTDVLLCDEGEAGMIFDSTDLGDALAAAHAIGPRVVAIKRGSLGVVVSDGRIVVDQPAIPVLATVVREAVGAGDAFDAGFLDALIRGTTAGEAARFATATAALSLSGRGGAEGITSREAVEATLDRVPPATSHHTYGHDGSARTE